MTEADDRIRQELILAWRAQLTEWADKGWLAPAPCAPAAIAICLAVDERDALRKRNLDLIGALGTADGKIADLRKQVEKLERDLARARESGLQSCQLLKECGERVAELETSLHEARMLLPYEWRKEPE